jgi:hypothetical protein
MVEPGDVFDDGQLGCERERQEWSATSSVLKVSATLSPIALMRASLEPTEAKDAVVVEFLGVVDGGV